MTQPIGQWSIIFHPNISHHLRSNPIFGQYFSIQSVNFPRDQSHRIQFSEVDYQIRANIITCQDPDIFEPPVQQPSSKKRDDTVLTDILNTPSCYNITQESNSPLGFRGT